MAHHREPGRGVAPRVVAFSVHLINALAFDEFSQAVRSVNGEPDLELRSAQGSFDEAVFARVTGLPEIAVASPVLKISTYALTYRNERVLLRVVGVDALVVGSVAPALMPLPDDDAPRLAMLSPNTVFLNASARAWAKPCNCKAPCSSGRSRSRAASTRPVRRWP